MDLAFPTLLIFLFHWVDSSSATKALHFNSWFPRLEPTLSNISDTTCDASLTAYKSLPNRGTCESHVNCILPNMLELDKVDMANAGILLGLLPVFVATFGPDIREIALLSSRRPLLSFLLAIGVPAVYVERPMEYADPLELLQSVAGRFTVGRLEAKRTAIMLSGLEYLFVTLAIINLLEVSYSLGLKTVLSWKCIPYLPMAWVLVPVLVHLLAALTFTTSKVMRHSEWRQTNDMQPHNSAFTRWIATEFLICANQPHQVLKVQAPGTVTVILNITATLMGSIHIIFGIIVFASLLFISLLDATLVGLRYMVSIIICRLILKFEIAGARGTFTVKKNNDQYELIERQSSTGLMRITYGEQRTPSEAEVQRFPANRIPI